MTSAAEIDYVERALWREYQRHTHNSACTYLDDEDECTETRTLRVAATKKLPLAPDFRDGVEHVYDVRVAIAVGLMFDEPPTEEELKQAMWESFIEKASLEHDVQDDDIEYELLDVNDTMEDKA